MSELGKSTLKKLSHRRVLRIAIPIVLSNATVPILGAVDTGVVGQLGLAVLVPRFGNHGLWLALMLSFAVRGLTLGHKYPELDAEVARL